MSAVLLLPLCLMCSFPVLLAIWSYQRYRNRGMATRWMFPRIRRALARWIRARNERKLKRALGWKSGWESARCR